MFHPNTASRPFVAPNAASLRTRRRASARFDIHPTTIVLALAVAVSISCCASIARADETPVLRVDVGSDAPIGAPAVAVAGNGLTLAVWPALASAGQVEVRARWVIDDSPVGASFIVSSSPSPTHGAPQARVIDGGDFLIVWRDGPALRWRRYDGATQVPGAEQSVALDETPESLAIASDGDLGAAWRVPSSATLQAARFDIAGVPLGGVFEITSQGVEPVLTLGAAESVVAWTRTGGDDFTTTSTVLVRRFDDLNQPLGSELTVDSAVLQSLPFEGEQVSRARPARALDGAMLLVWDHLLVDQTAAEYQTVRSAIYDPTGVELARDEVGPSGQFNDGTSQATIAETRGGSFVVLWNYWPFFSGERSFAARRGAIGEPLQARVVVSNARPMSSFSQTFDTAAATLGDEPREDTVVWVSDDCGPGELRCLFLRRVPPTQVFTDGFESGDLGGWSSAIGDSP
ncbi:MAG: hypothetical protein AAGC60_08400 [Acidobacteriota bacterium]